MPKRRRSILPPLTWETHPALAAASIVQERVERVLEAARRARKSGKANHAERVHALRVSIRRVQTALRVFERETDKSARKAAMKSLKALRDVAGEARDADVHAALLRTIQRSRASPPAREAAACLIESIREQRDAQSRDLHEHLQKFLSGHGRRLRKLTKDASSKAASSIELRDHATSVLAEFIAEVSKAADRNIGEISHLHALRIGLKKLRYAVEVFDACWSDDSRAKRAAALAGIQEAMGRANDADTLLARVQSTIRSTPRATTGKRTSSSATGGGRGVVVPGLVSRASLRELEVEVRRRRDALVEVCEKVWRGFDARAIVDSIRDELAPPSAVLSNVPARAHPSTTAAEVEPKPLTRPHENAVRNGLAKSIVADSPPRRVAAIDVGTNSVRLIIAETTGDVSYRVLDDEKEVTRLGRGLGRTGRLDPGAMEHTAATIANMVAIARGYHATSIRAVATAATREASNAREFLELIKARAGIDVEIISGEREAELAFASASRAFDLAAQPSMVIDIGGGSMELIFVAPQFGPNASGVIDQVFSLPLGAVRLTEQFGGPEKAGGAKYHRVREHVLSTLQKEIGDPPLRLALVVGTGGTVTTLGTIARVRERAGQRADSGLGSVQGVEVSRAEIKHIIQQLRGLKVKDRARIAGLPADRADIFVAGLTAVDCALKFLGANRIRVHEGGIRDGLLLDMLGLPESLASDAADPIRSAERFAIACGYEAAHSNHVTALALRLFDLLNAQHINARRLEWQDEHRLLLQVASLLHDTGYLIGYAQHHKHSQHLIMHAGLRGLTSRQVQMVACIARYHRAAEPKASQRGFCELSREDQRSVEALSGILRVADGLDRTHTQGVNLGRLEKVGNSISLETRSEREPSVDLWGAKRKARLFERTFEVKLDLIWRSDQGETADRPRTKSGTPEHPPVLKRRLHRGGIEGVAKIREK